MQEDAQAAQADKQASKPRFATVEERRAAVDELWVRNVPVRRIASLLKVPHRTVRDDIVHLKREMVASRVADIEERRDRTIRELRAVIAECWTRLSRIKDTSNNVSGLMNTIVSSIKLVAQLEGTLDASMNITQVNNTGMSFEEWQAVQQAIMKALEPHVEARTQVADALMVIAHDQRN